MKSKIGATMKIFHYLEPIKFTNGFIRNNHDVIEISDRDFVKQNRNFGFKNLEKFQDYLVETFRNYNPDLVFFGHSDNITNKNKETFS